MISSTSPVLLVVVCPAASAAEMAQNAAAASINLCVRISVASTALVPRRACLELDDTRRCRRRNTKFGWNSLGGHHGCWRRRLRSDAARGLASNRNTAGDPRNEQG